MSDKHTIAIYDEKADEYGERTRDMGEKRELEAFAAALPANATVLDLGCGPGFYAAWLAERGMQVDATDASQNMVELAAAQPGVTAWQAVFSDLDSDAQYDGIWANFSLLHAPRDAMPDLLARIHRALRPGGMFHIGMKLGDGAGPDRIGRHYTYYTHEELTLLLTTAGFTIDAQATGSGLGLDGTKSDYITVLSHA